MKEIKPELETFARIKVVGVGGGGNHAIGRMSEAKLKGIDFIAVNADAQDLHHSKIAEKIHIGKNLTRGLGAGMNPDIGRQAAEENKDEIQDTLKNSDMVFVTCGLGGGTGTGAAPIIAEAAKDAGALTVAVVTKPFAFEGMQRKKIAEDGLQNLKSKVDTIITIPNDKILQVIDKKTPLLDSFKIVDDVLRQAVQGISDLITIPGIVNVDFADVRAIMQNTGPALMGIGRSSGENRAVDAAKQAINSPLLELSIFGAKGVLFNISGGSDLTMMEVNDAATIITESVDPEARVIFGAITDESLKKGEVKITVIATGFQNSKEDRSAIDNSFRVVNDTNVYSSNLEYKKAEEETKEEEEFVVKPDNSQKSTKKNLTLSISDVLKKDLTKKKKDDEEEFVVDKKEVEQNIENKIPDDTEKKKEEKVEIVSEKFNSKVSDVKTDDEYVPALFRKKENNDFKRDIENKTKEDNKPVNTFSSKVSNVKYKDEYDVPAFLRKKMNKNKK